MNTVTVNNRPEAADPLEKAISRAYRNYHGYGRRGGLKLFPAAVFRNLFSRNPENREGPAHSPRAGRVVKSAGPPEIGGSRDELFEENIRNAIDRLPDELRAFVILYYVDGFSYEDIAEISDAGIETVKNGLYTAGKFIKRRLSKYITEEVPEN